MDQKRDNLVLHNKSCNTITGMNHTISVSNELLEELPFAGSYQSCLADRIFIGCCVYI
jgi:hypothetical protein